VLEDGCLKFRKELIEDVGYSLKQKCMPANNVAFVVCIWERGEGGGYDTHHNTPVNNVAFILCIWKRRVFSFQMQSTNATLLTGVISCLGNPPFPKYKVQMRHYLLAYIFV
jgi:hypothetical protein